MPARSLSNLYQSADSILDNLFKTGGYGGGYRTGSRRKDGETVVRTLRECSFTLYEAYGSLE